MNFRGPQALDDNLEIRNSSLYLQHPIQRHPRPMLYVVGNLNAVDHIAVQKVFQGPAEVLGRDAKHGGAQAAGIVEGNYHFVFMGKLFAHAIDEMDFSAHGKLGTGGGIFDDLDQPFGGADAVGLLADLPAAFRMDNDLDVWVFSADFVNMFREKALVYRAMALP